MPTTDFSPAALHIVCSRFEAPKSDNFTLPSLSRKILAAEGKENFIIIILYHIKYILYDQVSKDQFYKCRVWLAHIHIFTLSVYPLAIKNWNHVVYILIKKSFAPLTLIYLYFKLPIPVKSRQMLWSSSNFQRMFSEPITVVSVKDQ